MFSVWMNNTNVKMMIWYDDTLTQQCVPFMYIIVVMKLYKTNNITNGYAMCKETIKSNCYVLIVVVNVSSI